ncbi:MAG: hypothetical protein D3918_14350 [Candidatus Electrothrix sp. AX2]|nr:hypothetical protein [Candidatus Electrothrix gigas]
MFQFIVLFLSISILYCSHRYRERFVFERKEFPQNISSRNFHFYLSDNLQVAKSNIRTTCAAFIKKYDFLEQDKDTERIEEYDKRDLERLVEDMQDDLNILKERIENWDKPPYSKLAPPEIQDDSGLLRNSSQQE